MAHYIAERNHQGLENRPIRKDPARAANGAFIHCRTRLSELLNYYYRAAA